VKLIRSIGLLLGITITLAAKAQSVRDSSYIQPAAKPADVETYTGIYQTKFRIDPTGTNSYLRHHKLQANTSAYVGLHFDYKWLSTDLSTSLPQTFVDNQIKGRKAYSLQLGKTTPRWRIEGLVEKYNGLLIPISRRRQEFQVFHQLGYRNYAAQATYIFNPKRFSLPASLNYGEQQLHSAGTFLVNLNPAFRQFLQQNGPPQKMNSQDSLIQSTLGKRTGWINGVCNGGYSYNLILDKGHWSINPTLMAGIGVQQELWKDDLKTPATACFNFRGMLSSGYNGKLFYAYLTTYYNTLKSRLPKTSIGVSNYDTYLTMGYRFNHSPRKLFGLL
jgi:hypothetical protein